MDLHAWKAPMDVKNSGCHISGPGPGQTYTASNTKLWGRQRGEGEGEGEEARAPHSLMYSAVGNDCIKT